VSAKRAAHDPLFERRWVHVFEEDTAAGAVYRAEGDAIPLSRRPREQLELARDGSARFFVPAPDDRLVEQPASWQKEDDEFVVRVRDGRAELRIVDRSPTRLVVQVRPRESPR
jgi:hypothetical protein